MVKKYCLFFVLIFVPSIAASEELDYFASKQNQVTIYFGQGLRNEGPEPLGIFNFVYSQPDYVFRIKARRNFELLKFFGKDACAKYDCYLAGLSQDITVHIFKNVFVGAGLGFFISNKQTDRVDSKFMFGQKLFIGARFGNECVELMCRHFSNGSLTKDNSGYTFVGACVTHNF
jgi:hypothetical protein